MKQKTWSKIYQIQIPQKDILFRKLENIVGLIFFFKENQKIPTGLVIGFHKIPIDPEIIKQLVNFGISIEYAEKCIETNRHNHVTTTYYLLLKRYLIAGNKSIADISSELFDPQRISIRQTTQTDRKSSKPQNPLPLIQIKNRRNNTQQADDSPIDTKPRLNNSVNTQNTILQQSPTTVIKKIETYLHKIKLFFEFYEQQINLDIKLIQNYQVQQNMQQAFLLNVF